MCGIAGEVRRDDDRPDLGAVEAMVETMVARGPDGGGVWSEGGVALGHRRLRIIDLSDAGAQPMVDPDLGLTVVFNGCIYNYQELRAELSRPRLPLLLAAATPRCCSRRTTGGATASSTTCTACSPSPSSSATPAGCVLGPRPARHQAAVPGRGRPARALRLDPPGAAGRRRRRHPHRPGRAAPLPDASTRSSRRRARSCAASGSCRRRPSLAIEPDGRRTEDRYWGARLHPPARARRLDRARTGRTRCSPRSASPSSGAWSPTCPVGVPAVGRARLQPHRRPAGRGGPARPGDLLASASSRSAASRATSSATPTSSPSASAPTTTRSASAPTAMLPGRSTRAIAAMSEPMVSHDVRRLLPAQRGGVASTCKVVQSGQGADEVFAGYHWYPPLATAPRPSTDRARRLPARRSSTATTPASAGARRRRYALRPTTPAGGFVAEPLRPRPAPTPPSTGPCASTPTVMLVDDPVKRVDNMTMAWGLEARVPFLDHELVELAAQLPAGAQARPRRQGRAQGGRPPGDPRRGHRPPEGLLPGPGADPPRGRRTSTWCATRCTPRRPRSGGCSGPRHVDAPAAPTRTAELTPLRGNELWQLGLLELWLQAHGVAVSAARHDVRPCGPRDDQAPRRSRSGSTTTPRRPTSRTRWPTTSCSTSGGAGWCSARPSPTPSELADVLRRGGGRPPRHLRLPARPARPGGPAARTSCSSTRSHTYRLPLRRRPAPAAAAAAACVVRRIATGRERLPRPMNRDLRALRDGPGPRRRHLGQPRRHPTWSPTWSPCDADRRGRRHRHRRRPRAALRRPRAAAAACGASRSTRPPRRPASARR